VALDCGIARATFGDAHRGPEVEQRKPNRAHQPGLPHAPRKGCYGEQNGECRSGERLGFKWQKSYSEHSRGTGDRHQDYANYAELIPSLEK
jgi:hypothetical protein